MWLGLEIVVVDLPSLPQSTISVWGGGEGAHNFDESLENTKEHGKQFLKANRKQIKKIKGKGRGLEVGVGG